ncbi:coiled-coil alpha-helical rod protein 1-like [Lineus longissimus]|uniref:coiled-coil alpha-helical rod protein 1-like n=1 Tax=Lineus longissimus TaxID=88925 RepID=UPI002B4E7AC4
MAANSKNFPISPPKAGMAGKPELLPPSSFETSKPEDPWKAYAKATQELVSLKFENQRLRDERKMRPETCISSGEKEIHARVDVHHQQPSRLMERPHHYDDIITRQAGEIARLQQQLEEVKGIRTREVAELEAQLSIVEKERDKLEGNVRNIVNKNENELQQLQRDHDQEVTDYISKLNNFEDAFGSCEEKLHQRTREFEVYMESMHRESDQKITSLEMSLREKTNEVEILESKVSQLKTYLGKVEDSSPEPLQKENGRLETNIKELQQTQSCLEMNNQLLNVRLESMNEILSLQEKELSRTRSELMDPGKQAVNLLTRWREKVFALLVQLKSVDITNKRDASNFKNEFDNYKDQIISTKNEVQVLTHMVNDRNAELAMERNSVKSLEQELTKVQQLALALDDKAQVDVNQLQYLVAAVKSMFEKACSTEATFQDVTSKLKTYMQRISFASKRVTMLQGQFARKEALVKLQITEGSKMAGQVVVESRMEEPEKDSMSYSELIVELDRVTLERDHLVDQMKQDAGLLKGKVEEARRKYENEVVDLRNQVLRLEQAVRDKTDRCHNLDHQLENCFSELDDSRVTVESLTREIKERHLQSAIEEQAKVTQVEFTEQLASLEKKLNEARKEHTKAVVTLRQFERQAAREKDRSADYCLTLEKEYSLKMDKLKQQVRSLEQERNLMMATLRQEGLLKKVHSSPVQDLESCEPSDHQEPGVRAGDQEAAGSQDPAKGQAKESLKAVMDDIKSLTSEMFEDDDQ